MEKEMENGIKGKEIDDGRKDVIVSINGEKALIMPQEYALKLGYENAKAIMSVIAAQIQVAANILGPTP